MPHAVHIIRSLYKFLRSYRDRRIHNTAKHVRWSVLQKEYYLSAGAQPEVFHDKGGRGGGGWFVELGHFVKHFVKNAGKRGLTCNHFGTFFPIYSWNYILKGTFNPKMDTIRVFLSKIGHFFQFSKRTEEAFLLLSSYVHVSVADEYKLYIYPSPPLNINPLGSILET